MRGPGPPVQKDAAMFKAVLSLPRTVWFVGLISLVNDSASEMIYPLVPLYLAPVLMAMPRRADRRSIHQRQDHAALFVPIHLGDARLQGFEPAPLQLFGADLTNEADLARYGI